jgi:hypothetical protein
VELDEGLKLSLDEDTSIRKEEACRPYAKNSFRLSTFLCQKLASCVCTRIEFQFHGRGVSNMYTNINIGPYN